MTHNEVIRSLADHLRESTAANRMVWTDMQLGPSGSPRPDVYTIERTYTRLRPLAYEVKVSTADYRRDVTTGKWQEYLNYASAVIFATPAGLIRIDELPKGCGLIQLNAGGWRTAKAPTLQPLNDLSRDAWLKLLIDGTRREAQEMRIRNASAWKLAAEGRGRLTKDVCDVLRDIETARYDARRIAETGREDNARARKRHEEQHAELVALRNELCAALGLGEGYSNAVIREAIRRLEEPRHEIAEDCMRHLEWAMKQLRKHLPATSPTTAEL